MALTHHRPDIDGLRAAAVLAVVLHHLWPAQLPGGYVGVDVFFVISGYLITGIIRREMAEGHFSFLRFYERRARRIFPALFTVLAATLAAGYFVLLPSDYARALRTALATVFFSSNVLFWREGAGYFDVTDGILNPLLHTWSLGVEEQFYFLFPLLLFACHRYFRRHLFGLVLACALVSLAGALLLVHLKGNSLAAFFLSPVRAWELLAGALLAWGRVPPVAPGRWREALAAGGLGAIVAASFAYSAATPFPGLAALAPVLGAAALIHAGSSGTTLTARLLQCRPLRYLGLISYSLYLWHWPLLALVQYANAMTPPEPYLGLVLLASVALASASYHFIEQPFRRGGTGPGRFALPGAAGLALALTLFCLAGLFQGGFASRFEPQVVKLDQDRSPVIPYRDCAERPLAQACRVGDPQSPPDVLLWGDSHLLAWAPALHASLMEANKSALLLPQLACPPLFHLDNALKPHCAGANEALKRHLALNPQIATVVLAAYWHTYFREDGPLKARSEHGRTTQGIEAAQSSLRATLGWLAQQQRRVVLIGPVPVYGQSIPARLALERLGSQKMTRSSAAEQTQLNTPFLRVVQGVAPTPLFQYLDPIDWLCAQECELTRHGLSLYRDAHHLSVAGALALQPRLSAGLALTAQTLSDAGPAGLEIPLFDDYQPVLEGR